MTVSLITDIQVRFCPVIRFSFLPNLRGVYLHICLHIYELTMNQFVGSVRNMTVGRSPYHLTEMDLGSFVYSIYIEPLRIALYLFLIVLYHYYYRLLDY